MGWERDVLFGVPFLIYINKRIDIISGVGSILILKRLIYLALAKFSPNFVINFI